MSLTAPTGISDAQKTLKAPTLQIATAKDAVCPPDLVQLSRDWIEDLSVEVIDTSHWAVQEKPQEWNALVERFLAAKGL